MTAHVSTRTLRPMAGFALACLAAVLSVQGVLAAGLSVGLLVSGSAGLACALDACSGSLSGDLNDPDQPGTYQLLLTLDPPADISSTAVCFTPTAGGTNVATLSFTSSSAPGQLVLSTGSLCLPTDLSIESGSFSIPFTVTSGTESYAGASGTGVLTGQFDGSILLGSELTLLSVSSSDFTVPVPNPCPDPAGCNSGPPPPPPGATPELDSLVLFGSGLTGIATCLLRRRRS